MKAISCEFCMTLLFGIVALLCVTAIAAPMNMEDEQSENSLEGHTDTDMEMADSWESINMAALHKLLLQLDADERMNRVARAWPQLAPRGWALRTGDGRPSMLNRNDKRQVRFRQCYFNPISCFRK